jgi:hypothetical protein
MARRTTAKMSPKVARRVDTRRTNPETGNRK